MKSAKNRNAFKIHAMSRKAGVMPKKKDKFDEDGWKKDTSFDAEDDELLSWYVGPLTKERLAELRYKLAKARGLLVSFIDWETDDKDLVPTTQEVKDILKETEDQ
jgi:hypothetical protein